VVADTPAPAGLPGSAGGPDRRARPLLLGAIVNGTTAAAAMWLAGRSLGLESFEPLAQLWTLWNLTATGLVFAFQQWEIMRSAGHVGSSRARVPRGVLLALALSTAAALALLVPFREPIFSTDALAWPLAAATLPAGTAVTGISYAVLASRGSYGRLATLSAGENTLRLLVTGMLVASGAPALLFAVTVPVGFLVAALPLVLIRPDRVRQRSASRGPALIAVYALMGFATTFLVFGGPFLLGASGGAPGNVSALFLILIPVRVPFLLLTALLPAIAVKAARLAADPGRRRVLRSLARRALAVAASGAVVAGAIAWWLGDGTAELLFGAGGQLPPATFAAVLAAAVLCLGAMAMNVAVIALDRTLVIATAWLLVVASGLVATVASWLADPVVLGAWMLACAVVIALVQLAVTRSVGPVAVRTTSPSSEARGPGRRDQGWTVP
jgi:hypothetical protein